MKNLSPDHICGSNFGYWKFSLERCLNDVADLGLTKFDLWGISPHMAVDHTGSAEIAKMKSSLSERDIELVCFTPEQCIYPVNYVSEDEKLRDISLKYFKRAAEISSELECPNLFIICGWGDYDQPREEAWERSVTTACEIVEYAQSLGVDCITETLKPTETNLVITADDMKKYIDDVGSPHLKVCIDTVAMAVSGETPKDHFKLFGDKIVHSHFVDGTPKGHMAWGDGNLPLEQYLKEFDEFGYSGLFMPEISAIGYGIDPTSALKRAVSGLRQALSK